FIRGCGFYAVLYASAGALVNRPEDTQAVSLPIMLPLLIGYVFVVSSVSSPENPVTTFLSFLPLTAPVAMPLRIQLGLAPWWQVVISVALMLATMAVLLKLAGKVYAGGLLRTGRRVRVREALAAADDLA